MTKKELIGRDLILLAALKGKYEPDVKSIQEELNERSTKISYGATYRTLEKLNTDGLVYKESIDERTNYYGITERGERILEQHIDILFYYITEEQIPNYML